MSTSQPDPIAGVLAMIAERRAALDSLAGAIQACRDLDLLGAGLTVEAIAVEEPAPVRQLPPSQAKRRQPQEPDMPPRTGRGGRGRIDRSELAPAISAFLDRQTAPITFAALCVGVKSYPGAVRKQLDPMVAAGAVVRVGNRAGQRLGRPAVMRGDTPKTAAAPKAITRVKATLATTWSGLLDDRLATGASYAFEDLYRTVQRVDATVTGEAVRGYLDQLRVEGKAVRIPAGDSFRYQRRVAPRAKTA